MLSTAFLVHAVYLATGATAGLLSGLLGIGGGLVMVPALFVCFAVAGMPAEAVPPLALGTSLTVVCLVSALTSRENLRLGHLAGPFSTRMAVMAACLAVGVAAGAWASTQLPARDLLRLLGLFQIAIGMRMWLAATGATRQPAGIGPDTAAQDRLCLPGACTLLFVTGGVSSIGGVGGATLMTPYFTRAGIEYRQAAALSTFFGCVVGAAGFVSYGLLARPVEPLPASIGYVSLPAVASMAIGSVLLVRVGAELSRRVSRAMLTRGFCCFLFASGLKLLLPLGLAGTGPA